MPLKGTSFTSVKCQRKRCIGDSHGFVYIKFEYLLSNILFPCVMWIYVRVKLNASRAETDV